MVRMSGVFGKATKDLFSEETIGIALTGLVEPTIDQFAAQIGRSIPFAGVGDDVVKILIGNWLRQSQKGFVKGIGVGLMAVSARNLGAGLTVGNPFAFQVAQGSSTSPSRSAIVTR